MSAARDLLDRFWAYHVEVDDFTPLWDSQLDQLERWISTSPQHTAEVRRRMLGFRDEALALAAAGGDDAPSLVTAADAALLTAAMQGVQAEQELAHPTLGLHSFLHWAVNNYPLRTADHGERYLAKLTALDAAVAELGATLAVSVGEGRAPLARHARRAVALLDEHLAAPLDDDPILRQAPPSDLAPEAAAAWRDRLADTVADHVRPALGRLRDVLRDVVAPAGRDDDACGLLHVRDGVATYALLLEAYTAPGLTPEAVHATGLAQVERLAAEYVELGSSVLGTDELAEIFRRLREDRDLYFDTADQVVAAASAMHARARAAAPTWFLRQPRADCEVRAVEHGSLAFYSRPAEDGSRPGVFFFNTSDPSMWGPNLASTVFHEGIPGHHFQLALAGEDGALHRLHRELYLPAFGEGWALYTERLADDMGLYVDDLERLGMLMGDSLRACRLVVDTGMHALGWSRQQAVDYLLANSPLGEVEVTAEVDRYIGMPGQATSYMTGRLWIERLRDDAAARLGDDFDLRRFHDVVLSRGMLSLPALEVVVDTWVRDLLSAERDRPATGHG